MPATLITGATGFVGSHFAEACVSRGLAVRALVRPTSDTTLLRSLGVDLVEGDFDQPERLREAVDGVAAVVHCAARLGDWGPVEDYRRVNVDGLRRLLEACVGRPLTRFVHLSSLGVYASRHHYGTDESEPLPAQHVDGYTQSKVEAEQLASSYQSKHAVPVVILRPGFIYGPRDRTVLPQLISNLRQGQVRWVGGGRAALNCIYVGNLVDAIFLALEKPGVVGKVFNLTDGEVISKRRFIETLAEGVGAPRPPRLSVPFWFARLLAGWMEWYARRTHQARAPRLTQARLKFLGYNLDFSIARARSELGYAPATTFDEGMARTVTWLKQHATQ